MSASASHIPAHAFASDNRNDEQGETTNLPQILRLPIDKETIIQLPPRPLHLIQINALLDDMLLASTQKDQHVDTVFRALKAYLKHFTCEFSKMLTLQNCPVQTQLENLLSGGSASHQHHNALLKQVLIRINDANREVHRTIEDLRAVPSAADIQATRLVTDRIFPTTSTATSHMNERLKTWVKSERPQLPSMQALIDITEPYICNTSDGVYGTRLKYILLLFKTMNHEYEDLWEARKNTHLDVRRFFTLNAQRLCHHMTTIFDSKLVPQLTLLLRTRQTEENQLHARFQQQTLPRITHEKSEFYNHLKSWTEVQVASGLRLLDVIHLHISKDVPISNAQQNIDSNFAAIQRKERQAKPSSIESSSHISTMTPSVSLKLSILRPVLHDNEDRGLQYPRTDVSPDIVDAHTPLFGLPMTDEAFQRLGTHTQLQHNYLKEALLAWQGSFVSLISNSPHTHPTLLPDMMNHLLKWLRLAEVLLLRVMQHDDLRRARTQNSTSTTSSHSPETQIAINLLTLQQIEKQKQVTAISDESVRIRTKYETIQKSLAKLWTRNDLHVKRQVSGAVHVSHSDMNNDDDDQSDNSNANEDEDEQEKDEDMPSQSQSHSQAESKSGSRPHTPVHVRFNMPKHNLQHTLSEPKQVPLNDADMQNHALRLMGIASDQSSPDKKKSAIQPDVTIDVQTHLPKLKVEEGYRLKFLLRQRRTESAECKVKLEQVQEELMRQETQLTKYRYAIEFLNSFQSVVVPEWYQFIEQERNKIQEWNQTQLSYHKCYIKFRHDTVHQMDWEIHIAQNDLCMHIERMFGDLFNNYSRWLQDLQILFKKRRPIILQSRESMHMYHRELTLELPRVSREIQLYDNALQETELLCDIFDINYHQEQMKLLINTFYDCFFTMSDQLFNSRGIRAFIKLMDKTCDQDHRIGFGFPLTTSIDASRYETTLAPSILLSTTRLDHVMYHAHVAETPFAKDEKTRRERQVSDVGQMNYQMQRVENAHAAHAY